jgi:hypothetical protein
VRKLQEYYAVLRYYKYRKRKWTAADASEPKCVSYVELARCWNIKRFLVTIFYTCFKISFISV